MGVIVLASPVRSGCRQADKFTPTPALPLKGEGVSKPNAIALARRHNPLEFGLRRCYIWVMLTRSGWMLRITGPILG